MHYQFKPCLVLLFVALSLTWTLAFSSDEIVNKAQNVLTEKGYEPGPADGQIGTNTINAIRQFQSDSNIPVSGELDDKTLQKLGIDKKGVSPGTSAGVSKMVFKVSGLGFGQIVGLGLYLRAFSDGKRITFIISESLALKHGLLVFRGTGMAVKNSLRGKNIEMTYNNKQKKYAGNLYYDAIKIKVLD